MNTWLRIVKRRAGEFMFGAMLRDLVQMPPEFLSDEGFESWCVEIGVMFEAAYPTPESQVN